jgi:hypothetical protein
MLDFKKAFVAIVVGTASAYAACSGGTISTSSSGGLGTAVPLGAACVPSNEISPSYGGSDELSVEVDPGNPACGGGVCLSNHFRGRVTCPYGKSADGGAPPGAQPCTVPGTTTPVTAGVPAQCTDRSAQFTVYCSCRCANANGRTDDGASYCACDRGYECAQLFASGNPNDTLAGGYCVKTGTTFDRGTACQTTCAPPSGRCSVPDAGALPGSPDGGSTLAFIAVVRPQGGLCLPSALATDASGRARCRILEALAPGEPCAAHAGLTDGDAATAAFVRAQQSVDPGRAICVLPQLAGVCTSAPDPGWCYVTAPSAPNGCAQTIMLSPSGAPPAGATVFLACP